MENSGEHLIGQYLKFIKKCDFVNYNIPTIEKQGEIDVIGINTKENILYICEVAIHLITGIQYTKNGKPNNVDNLVEKFKKNISYVKREYPKYNYQFMLWTPYAKQPKKDSTNNNQVRDLLKIKDTIKREEKIEIEMFYNETFLNAINELRRKAIEETKEIKSPIMRFLQIEETLKKHFIKRKKY